jgi:serine/threonine-protein kinase
MTFPLLIKPGTTLGQGRYVIQRLIHQGQVSLTVQASQIPGGKIVILKLPIQDNGLMPYHRQRFQHIWQRSGHFQHPYLQQTLDYLAEEGFPCLVLEPIPGESLAQRLLQSPFPEAVALRCIIQAGQAVQQIHDRGLIHGNISPQNLICHAQSKSIVLVDWGLFWLAKNTQNPYSAPEPFMPPEVRVNLDVYGLAACLYTLVTGKIPLSAAERIQTELIPPQTWCPQISQMTQDAILRGMNLESELRPASIQSWLSLLPSPQTLPSIPPSPESLNPPEKTIVLGTSQPNTQSNIQSNLQSNTHPGIALPPKFQSPPYPATAYPATPYPSTLVQSIAALDPPETPYQTHINQMNGSQPHSTAIPSIPTQTIQTQGIPTSPTSIASSQTPSSQALPSFPNRSMIRPFRTSIVVMTIAGICGLFLGGILRWQQAQSRLAVPFFGQEQSFPNEDWPGTLELEFPDDAPLPEQNGSAGSADTFIEAEPNTEWVIPSEAEAIEQPIIEEPLFDPAVDPTIVESSLESPEQPPEAVTEVTEVTEEPGELPPETDVPATDPASSPEVEPDPAFNEGTEDSTPSAESDLDSL